jgi:hypothetical protein
MTGKTRILAMASGVSMLLICCAPSADRAGFVSRDSAGVRIVVNTSPQWNPDDEWRLSPTPIREMRTRSDVADEALYGVRGVVRLSNGQYVVANGGNHELRWYEPNGQFVERVGREGGGPGEFRSLTGVARLGTDSVMAWDRRNQQVSVFTVQASYLGVGAMGTTWPRSRGVCRWVFVARASYWDE